MDDSVWPFFGDERQAVMEGAHLLALRDDAANRAELRATSETNLKSWLAKRAEAETLTAAVAARAPKENQ